MGDWTVIGDEPGRSAGGQSEGGWTVVGETPSRGRRGPRSPNGSPTAPTRGQGATPDNPIPYGGRAQRGQYIVSGDGVTMLRGNDGVFRRVELPGVNSGGGFNGMTRRDAQRRQAASTNVQAPRPDRGVLGWRAEDAIAPGREAFNALVQGGPPPNPLANPNWSPLNIPGDMLATAGRDLQQGGNLLGLAFSPVSGAVNMATAPLARGLTNIGIGNDTTNNNALTQASTLLVPERPRGGFAAAAGNPLAVAGGRYGAVPNETPAMAPVANDAPPPAPAAWPRPQGTRRQDQVALLRREGVTVTPGQARGPIAASVEDKLTSAPILGSAINDARTQSNLALNRAVASRTLAPIGERLPGGLEAGTETVGYVEGRIGDAYTRAAGMVKSAQADNELLSTLQDLRNANTADLPPATAQLFDQIISERVSSRFANGTVDGAMLKQIQSEIGGLAAKYGSSTDGAQRILGERLGDVRNAIGGLVSRSSPEAAALQTKADRAWANFVRLQTAAARGGEGGVFNAAQLRAAIKALDKSIRKGAVARGDALMQDLADAAVGVMGNKTPDSGTAGRSALLGMGALAGANPPAAALAATGLGAASIPYRVMARRLAVAATRPGATPEEIASALTKIEEMAKADPKGVAQWLKQVRDAAKVYGIVGLETDRR